MILKSIKLSGFKSFVDSTLIPISSNLTGIVGPNGCGKSNVVDAIRWVIGESSAKQLRGQSMADVIFNGASNRKPVAMASVELVFSNDQGRLTGEFAKFSEISIRREVYREGDSHYYLNGVQCRRKDIINLFLGTGLGPRSYSIIEQGIISELIEAKPEELRTHLEEVAGISKYKERRRETELRMQHTQENLSRLKDINEELTKQLRHLKKQADSAEKYTVLKNQERTIQAEIKAIHWMALQQQIKDKTLPLDRCQQVQDEELTNLRNIEKQLEQSYAQNTDFTVQRDVLQKQFYELGAGINRSESEIHNLNQQMQRWRQELTQASKAGEELENHHQQQLKIIDQLLLEQSELTPQMQAAKAEVKSIDQTEQAALRHMADWQQQWDIFQAESAKFSTQISVLKANKDHHAQQLKILENRQTQLVERLNQNPLQTISAEIEPLTEQVAGKRQELKDLQDGLQKVTEEIRSIRQKINNSKQELTVRTRKQQNLQGQYVSLEAVQRSALGYQNNHTKDWLQKHDIASHSRLGQVLQVVEGWEQAVETVLGENIEAVCVDELDSLIYEAEKLTQGRLTLLKKSITESIKKTEGLTSLASFVKSPWPVSDWLSTIYVAQTLSEAQLMRDKLAAHESIITQQGVWIGTHWVRVNRKTSKESGVLIREQELKTLKQCIEDEKQSVDLMQAAILADEEALKQLEEQRDFRHQQYQKTSVALTEAQAKLSGYQSRFQELQNQQERLNKEISDCVLSINNLKNVIEKNLFDLNELTSTEQLLSDKHKQLADQKSFHRQQLDSVRHQAVQLRRQADELSLRLSNVSNQLSLQQQNNVRDTRQRQQLNERCALLQKELNINEKPVEELRNQLQIELTQHAHVEQNLRQAEESLRYSQQHLEELKKSQLRSEKKLTEAKNQLQQLQMERQALEVRQTTILEQLQEQNWSLDQLIPGLDQNASVTGWEKQLEDLKGRISRLGAINLAAIEEYQTVNERKNYLDRQQADLEQALEILQTAISKIDRETRVKFQETFEQVNQNFQELFPRIFNGGKAALELVEQDALTAGVLVKAQPPGKRNATIYMLSGGEKALTAVALVFAMFRLNPAPFCVLDEVDAPLDDVNTGRFCQLVKEMSKTTQFIIISHNKVTISISEHLMGVTMQEAGVSRIVSVNVAEAVALAEV